MATTGASRDSVGGHPAAPAPVDSDSARATARRLVPSFSSLRWRLAAVFIALATPPLLVAAAYVYIELPANLEEDARIALSAEQRSASRLFERHIAGVEADASILAGLPALQAFANGSAGIPGSVLREFGIFASAHPSYLQLRYLDAAGHERVRLDRVNGQLVSVPDAALQDKSSRYYVEATAALSAGDVYVSPLDLNRERGEIQDPHVPVIRFAAPVAAESGTSLGFIINLDATSLVNSLRATSEGESDTDLLLVDEDGYYLVHPDPARSWSGPNDLDTGWNLFQDVPALVPLVGGSGNAPGMQVELQSSDQQLVAGFVEPVDRGWLLAASAPESAILAPARSLRLKLLAVFGAMTAIGLVVIYYASDRLSRPARLLREGAAQIGDGDFQHRIDLPISDELGEVARSFDQMAERLEESYRTLEGRVAERTLELHDRDEKLQSLNEIGIGLVAAGSTDAIGARAAEYARRLTAADRVIVTLAGEDDTTEAFESPTAATVDAEHPSEAHALTQRIERGDHAIGTIEVTRTGDSFAPVDRELLLTLANQVGVAIENANLHARERQTVTRLEELNQAKTDFVSTVSHQLRTPVAALRGYAEIIDAHGADLGEDQRDRILGIMAVETEHLTELVEDVLRVSRIDSGRLTPERRPILLAPLLDEVASDVRLLDHDAHPIALDGGTAPTLVIADPLLLKQSLLNLVENATKYSPPDSTIDVTWESEPAGEAVRITIEDDGPGIPSGERDRIFDRFVRLKGPDGEPMASGTGLGLYIARNVIEAHGGTIEATDGARGARFVVRLPIATAGSDR